MSITLLKFFIMETKFDELKKVLGELKISNSDLVNWLNQQNKNIAGFIPTKLPLVYCCGNVLTVENGLNLNRKDELWGIQLFSGTMVALKCGAENNVVSTDLEKVKEFAKTMRFNNKQGFLPDKDVLEKHWGEIEKAKFTATVNVLKQNKIEADDYVGYIWCNSIHNFRYVYCFDLRSGCSGWFNGNNTDCEDRVAVAFY